jgi:hypothetical protein
MGREVKRVPLDYEHDGNPEPTKGKGWQMWTTTEERPMSPVFNSPQQLARWLTDSKASAFGHQKATYDEWLSMIHEGSSLTGFMNSKTGKTKSGVAEAHENPSRLGRARKLASQVKAHIQQARGKEHDREH